LKRENPEIDFAKMEEDGDLEDGIRVKMDELDFEVIKQATEEIVARNSKSPLEEGFWHHNFSGVGSRNIFTFGHLPLEHGLHGQEVVLNKSENLFLINGWGLWHLGVWGGHGCGGGEWWEKGDKT
jgi:hypothetical protein